MAECIVIDNDGQFTPFADYTQRLSAEELSNQEIIKRVQEAAMRRLRRYYITALIVVAALSSSVSAERSSR